MPAEGRQQKHPSHPASCSNPDWADQFQIRIRRDRARGGARRLRPRWLFGTPVWIATMPFGSPSARSRIRWHHPSPPAPHPPSHLTSDLNSTPNPPAGPVRFTMTRTSSCPSELPPRLDPTTTKGRSSSIRNLAYRSAHRPLPRLSRHKQSKVHELARRVTCSKLQINSSWFCEDCWILDQRFAISILWTLRGWGPSNSSQTFFSERNQATQSIRHGRRPPRSLLRDAAVRACATPRPHSTARDRSWWRRLGRRRIIRYSDYVNTMEVRLGASGASGPTSSHS
jgi:hypothetical protein